MLIYADLSQCDVFSGQGGSRLQPPPPPSPRRQQRPLPSPLVRIEESSILDDDISYDKTEDDVETRIRNAEKGGQVRRATDTVSGRSDGERLLGCTQDKYRRLGELTPTGGMLRLVDRCKDGG